MRLLPRAWRDAGNLSDWKLRLTPARAKALVEALHAWSRTWPEDADDAEDAAPFMVNVNAFLRPGTVVPEDRVVTSTRTHPAGATWPRWRSRSAAPGCR